MTWMGRRFNGGWLLWTRTQDDRSETCEHHYTLEEWLAKCLLLLQTMRRAILTLLLCRLASAQGPAQVEDTRHRAAIAGIDTEFAAVRKRHDARLKACKTVKCKAEENKRFKDENARLLQAKTEEQELHRRIGRPDLPQAQPRQSGGVALPEVEPATTVVRPTQPAAAETATTAATAAVKCFDSAYSTPAPCYTPVRTAACGPVRFGWGNCPDGATTCDWCYREDGTIFAYVPRGNTYTAGSSCDRPGTSAVWATQDRELANIMTAAGAMCTTDAKDGYHCTNIDPAKFKQAINCAR
jgi:hypothetical protein